MRRILLPLLCALLLLAGCTGERDGPVEVGAIYPTGGGQGPGGVEELLGVRLAAELASAKGGVRGRPIHVVAEPADSSDQAPGAVRRLAARGIRLVLGSYGSTISGPAAEEAARRGLLFWETGAVGELPMSASPGDRVFRFPPSGASLGRTAVAFVRDQLAPRIGRGGELRYTVAYVDDVYGRAVGLGAEAEVRGSGLTLAASLPYRLVGSDYPALAARVSEAGTDVLVVAAYLDDGVALRRAIREAGVPLVASIGTSSSYCMPQFGLALGTDAVGLFASDKPDGEVLDPARLAPDAAAALVWGREQYRRRYGEAMTAPALSGFSAAWALFHHVLPRAAGLRPVEVASAARAARLPVGGLPNGSGLEFAPPGSPEAGANLRAASVIWEWVSPGVRAVVWPPAYATSPVLALPIS